jgi:adhesin/invasin
VASTTPTITSPISGGTTAAITASIPGVSYVFNTGTIASGPAVLANSSAALTTTTQVADDISTVGLTVTLKDQYGNPANDRSVTVSSNHTGDTITTSPSVTNASGIATFNIKSSSTTGTTTLSITDVTDSNLTLTSPAPITWISSTGAVLTTPVGAAQSAIAGTAFSTPLSITVNDASSNPVSGQVVSWAITSGTGSLSNYSTTTNASGVASTIPTITNPVNGGTTATITASIPGASYAFISGTISSAAASSSTSSAALSTTTQVADNVSTVTLTVSLKDVYSNPTSGKNVTVVSSHSGDTITTSPGTTNASGVATFLVKSTSTSGTSSFTITDTTDGGLVIPGASSVTWVAASGVTLSNPTGAGQSATAGTAFTNPFTVTVKDSNNNTVSNQTVSWAITSGNGSLSSYSSVTNASGVASTTAIITNPGSGGTAAVITASIPGASYAFTTGTIIAAAASAGDSSAGLSLNTQVADNSSTVTLTVTLKDTYGNLASGRNVTVTSNHAGDTITTSPATTSSAGIATFLIKSSAIGSTTLTITDTTDANLTISAPSSITWIAATGASLNSPAGAGQAATAGVAFSSPLSITVKDAQSNLVSGQIVSWAITSGNGSLSSYSVTTNSSGVASITPTITNPGLGSSTAAITASIPGASYAFVTGTISSAAVSAANSLVASASSSQTANGISPVIINVTLLDAYLNPVSGKAVALSSSRGATDTLTVLSGTSNASGIATFSFVTSTAGAPVFSAVDVTDSVSVTSTVSVTVNANVSAPNGISYNSGFNTLVFTKGTSASFTPSGNTGGAVSSYSVPSSIDSSVFTGTGLSFNTTTGLISGTPTSLIAQTSFSVSATNLGGSYLINVSLAVNDVAPTGISYPNSNDLIGAAGSAMSFAPTGGSVSTITSYAVNSAGVVLLANLGLSFNATTGVISGTTTIQQSNAAFTVTANNSGGSQVMSLTLTVEPLTPSASLSTITASSSSVVANGTSTVTLTVTLRDQYSNLVSGKAVSVRACNKINSQILY